GQDPVWSDIARGDLDALTSRLGITPRASLADALPALTRWHRLHTTRHALTTTQYRVHWSPIEDPASTSSGRWIVIVPSQDGAGEAVTAIVRALAASGNEVATLEAHDHAALAGGLREIAAGPAVAGVLSLLALAERDAGQADVVAAVTVLQELGKAEIAAPLWIATREAVSAGGKDVSASPWLAGIWGFGRVARLEHPDRWGGLVDLPAVVDEHTARRVAALLSANTGEDELAVRATGVLARRLSRLPVADPATARWAPSKAGTVLITGGTGALGAHLARWLADGGAGRVVLASRRGPLSRDAGTIVAGLAALGTAVSVIACDVADRGSLTALIDSLPDLDAVIHAAGVLDDCTLDSLTPDRLSGVLRAKAESAVSLDELTRDRALSAFVLFSSFAATVGSAGQGNYAAANAVLDALAERRHARGLPAVSIAWGPWADAGMAASAGAAERHQRGGVRPLEPSLATAALQSALDEGHAAVAVADVDWQRLVPGLAAHRRPRLLDALPEAQDALAATAPGDAKDSVRARLESLSGTALERELLKLVSGTAIRVLGLAAGADLQPGRAFRELGMDSLTAVELRNSLMAATELKLPATLAFDYATPAGVAGHLRGMLGQEREPAESELARLETLLGELTAEELAGAHVTARLQSLLGRLAEKTHAANTGAMAERLREASSEEMFELIDNELGLSS
ncbi:MAG TPA: SDR family NAD(P)-dependent oxidoreductase, partial [Trebonia sp.]|nr:SDR family NAD(P)-dependent oxidoreductase [Trebonia sp.]